MQPARLVTLGALMLSALIAWRLLTTGDDDYDERFAVPEGQSDVREPPHVLPDQHKEEPAAPPPQPVVQKEVVETEYIEDQSCHYDEIAKNLTKAPVSIVPSNIIVEACVSAPEAASLRLFKPIVCPQPSYFDRSYREYTAPSQTNNIMVKPGDLPETVHYIWCGQKPFRFENYLSVLSAAKLMQPHKFMFHYHTEPLVDGEWYNTWFHEMKQSLSSLEMKQHEQEIACEVEAVTDLALNLVTSPEGGLYIGESTILTKVPLSWKSAKTAVHPEQATQPGVTKLGLLMAKPGVTVEALKSETMANAAAATTCHIVDEFNQGETSKDQQTENPAPCVMIPFAAYPKDVMDSTAPVVSLTRWVYYATASKVSADQSPDQPAPKVGHMVAFRGDNPWTFYSYLSCLSALHIAGLERLYIYGDAPPEGEWWSKLDGEQITFVPIERAHTVFQRPVRDVHHKTDILRYYILWKYGGVYMEHNTVWVNPIPMEDWQYPAVIGLDWARRGDWPQYFNTATLLAKPGAHFLKLVIDTFRYYIDDSEDFNKALMPYRVYEQHPRSLHIDEKFIYSDKTSVICWQGICHPAFHQGNQSDTSASEHHDLSDFSAFHFKAPKIPPSLESYATIKAGDDMFAQIGKKILEKSDRLKELDLSI